MQVTDSLTTTARWAQSLLVDKIDDALRTHRAAGLWTAEERAAILAQRNLVAALFGAAEAVAS